MFTDKKAAGSREAPGLKFIRQGRKLFQHNGLVATAAGTTGTAIFEVAFGRHTT